MKGYVSAEPKSGTDEENLMLAQVNSLLESVSLSCPLTLVSIDVSLFERLLF